MQRNAALDILESGGPTLDALAAAVEAKIARDTPANARILDDVRARVAMDVKGLIEAELWDMDKLTEASRIATKARELDPSPEMVKLHDTVLQEQYAYLMVPKQFSPARGGGSVTFKLNAYLDAAKDMTDPDKAETAQVGELIAKRFRLLNVTESRAVFEDTLRGRKIGYTLTGQIESML